MIKNKILLGTTFFLFILVSCQTKKRSLPRIVTINSQDILIDSCGYIDIDDEFGIKINELVKYLKLEGASVDEVINKIGQPYFIYYSSDTDDNLTSMCFDKDKNILVDCNYKEHKGTGNGFDEGLYLTFSYLRGKYDSVNNKIRQEKKMFPQFLFQFENNKLVRVKEHKLGAYGEWYEYK